MDALAEVIDMPFRDAVREAFNGRVQVDLVKFASLELIQMGHAKIIEASIECFDGKKHVFGARGFELTEAGLCEAAKEIASASNEYAEDRKRKSS